MLFRSVSQSRYKLQAETTGPPPVGQSEFGQQNGSIPDVEQQQWLQLSPGGPGLVFFPPIDLEGRQRIHKLVVVITPCVAEEQQTGSAIGEFGLFKYRSREWGARGVAMIQGKQQANTELKQGGAHTWVEQLRNRVVCANIVFLRFGDLLSGAKVNKELKRG